MTIKNLRKIVISYNAIGPYADLTVVSRPKGDALVIPFMFCPNRNPKNKGEAAVHENDRLFKTFLRHVDDSSLESIDVFIGKVDSGSLAMIRLFRRLLPDHWSKIFWVVCDCELEQKLELLENFGVPRCSESVYAFKDAKKPCRESYILLGRIDDDLGIAA